MSLVDTGSLRKIAIAEYADIVVGISLPGANEIRIFLRDGSFVDVVPAVQPFLVALRSAGFHLAPDLYREALQLASETLDWQGRRN